MGHAVALHTNDDYLKQPAMPTIQKMALYMESVGKYGDSPFLYPVYGRAASLSPSPDSVLSTEALTCLTPKWKES